MGTLEKPIPSAFADGVGSLRVFRPLKEHPIAASPSPTRIRALRTASLTTAGVGAAITMGALGPWFTPVILLVATAGALLVIWRTSAGVIGARAIVPVLAVVVVLTIAALLGLIGILPSAWVWAALGAYAVAWGEYLVSQTIARSQGLTGYR